MISQAEPTSEDVIQQEMAKITLIKANLLRTIDSFREISPWTLRTIRQDLTQWYQQLPTWMHLSNLTATQDISETLRRIVYFVHLFYLSAHMLATRAVHGSQLYSNQPCFSEEMQDALKDGLIAARTTARILHIQLREGTIFRRCWLCE